MLTHAESELLNSMFGCDGFYFQTIMDNQNSNLGTKVLYLERATSQNCNDFLNSLDKLYHPELEGEPKNNNLELIRALKAINDICFNHEVKYDPYGTRRALEHYFNLVSGNNKINANDVKKATQSMIAEQIKTIQNKHLEEVNAGKAARLHAESHITPQTDWRIALDLPTAQRINITLDESRDTLRPIEDGQITALSNEELRITNHHTAFNSSRPIETTNRLFQQFEEFSSTGWRTDSFYNQIEDIAGIYKDISERYFSVYLELKEASHSLETSHGYLFWQLFPTSLNHRTMYLELKRVANECANKVDESASIMLLLMLLRLTLRNVINLNNNTYIDRIRNMPILQRVERLQDLIEDPKSLQRELRSLLQDLDPEHTTSQRTCISSFYSAANSLFYSQSQRNIKQLFRNRINNPPNEPLSNNEVEQKINKLFKDLAASNKLSLILRHSAVFCDLVRNQSIELDKLTNLPLINLITVLSEPTSAESEVLLESLRQSGSNISSL